MPTSCVLLINCPFLWLAYNLGGLPELDNVDDLLTGAEREVESGNKLGPGEVGGAAQEARCDLVEARLDDKLGKNDRGDRGLNKGVEVHADEEELVAEAEHEEGELAGVVVVKDARDVGGDVLVRRRSGDVRTVEESALP